MTFILSWGMQIQNSKITLVTYEIYMYPKPFQTV
jgi:hypothetical protein